MDRSNAAARGGAAAAAAADGTFTISDQVLRLWQQQGKGAGVAAAHPVVMGTNADEGTIFVYGVFSSPLLKMLEADAILTLVYGVSNLGKIKKQYPLPKSGDLRPHLSVVVTDSLFRCPMRAAALTRRGSAGAAAANAAYQYHFDQVCSAANCPLAPRRRPTPPLPNAPSWKCTSRSLLTPACPPYVPPYRSLPMVITWAHCTTYVTVTYRSGASRALCGTPLIRSATQSAATQTNSSAFLPRTFPLSAGEFLVWHHTPTYQCSLT